MWRCAACGLRTEDPGDGAGWRSWVDGYLEEARCSGQAGRRCHWRVGDRQIGLWKVIGIDSPLFVCCGGCLVVFAEWLENHIRVSTLGLQVSSKFALYFTGLVLSTLAAIVGSGRKDKFNNLVQIRPTVQHCSACACGL
ncbi:unnamed protein product [Polarella glacialis]|uniref:Uncharacterized protein n=1 Tax=Polarella glacialis TaxID=89957 RepID=A0A813H9J7_POLGL|nr:unnamed protein product [Polarella glacialis]